jgi:hypothetical protein
VILLYAGQLPGDIVDLGNLSRISAHHDSYKILVPAQIEVSAIVIACN